MKKLTVLIMIFVFGFIGNVNALTKEEIQMKEIAKIQCSAIIDMNKIIIKTFPILQNDSKIKVVKITKKSYIKFCKDIDDPYDPMHLILSIGVISSNTWEEDHIDKDFIEGIQLINEILTELIIEIDKLK